MLNRKFIKIAFLVIISIFFSLDFITKTFASTNNKNFNNGYSKIRVVMDDNDPPYIFKNDNGIIQGILVDEWKLWEQKTGIKVELNAMSWDKAQTEMKSGKYDVIDTIFIDEERKKFFDFSKSYAKIDVPIYFQNNISGITDSKTLSGFEIAVKKGDYSVNFLKNNGIINLTEYDNYDDIIDAAKNRRVSIFVMDKPPAQYLMYKANIQDKYNYSKPLYTGEFHRAVKKGNTQLLEIVNQGFDLISKDEYRQINSKWSGSSIVSPKQAKIIKYVIFILSAVFLTLLGLNWTLKEKINEKTKQLLNVIDELKDSENENTAIIRAIPDYVFILDYNGTFLDFLSEHLTNKVILTRERFVGKRINDIFNKETSEAFMNSIKSLYDNGELQVVEFNMPLEGKIFVLEARIVKYNKNRILAMVRNVTEQKIAQDKIYKMGMFDVLTGLYNRNYFEKEMKRFKNDKISNAAIVICDVDGLKLINDSLGHAIGDEYLKKVSEILRSCFSGKDIIARIGGDEFAVLIKDTSNEKLNKIKINIKNSLNKINSDNNSIPVSISVGFAILNENSNDLQEIFKEADDFMYRDKLHHLQSRKGKNIEILMNMLEARDFITQGHGERMEQLAGLLGESIKMTDEQISEIMLLAKFHDIGKIGIPDSILFKNDRLTNEEKVIMKKHTEIGYRIANSSPDLMHISDYIFKHHEAWNGSGYPFKLKGDEIPIQCRILAIVDAYDAMTNDRPYRKAMTKKEALDEIEKCKGKQFDPYLADKFLQIIDK